MFTARVSLADFFFEKVLLLPATRSPLLFCMLGAKQNPCTRALTR